MRENLNQSKTPTMTRCHNWQPTVAHSEVYSLLPLLQSLTAAAASDPESSIISPPT